MSQATTNRMTDRRPIKSRNLAVMQWAAGWLDRVGVSPNAISLSSMAFALAGAGAMLAAASAEGFVFRGLCLTAAVMTQLRLLANLLDGLVAERSAIKSPTGPLMNEWPDRVSDVLLILGFGLLAGESFALTLAALASCAAIATAYVRELGRAVGAPQMFHGPMAKPQRMALLTVALLGFAISPGLVEWLAWGPGQAWNTIHAVLGVMLLGCLVTCARRLRAIHRFALDKEQGDDHA